MGIEFDSDDFKVNCNIVLIGKSGAGKSSLANYLFGTDRFTTGTGVPVTTWEENFQQYFFDIDDVQVNVYDSVGLEPNNVSEWMEKFDGFLKSRGCGTSSSSVVDANKLIHLIIYVVNGGSGRFEDAAKLKEIKSRNRIKTAVAITNCDIAGEEKISAIEKSAHEMELETIRVCSISRKTRGGEKKDPYGKDELVKEVLSASYNTVGRKLMIEVLGSISSLLFKTKRDVIEKIDNSKISIFDIDAFEDFDFDACIDEMSEKLGLDDIDGINGFVSPSYKSYCQFVEKFESDFDEEDEFSHCVDTINNAIEDMEENFVPMKIMEEAMEKLENGSAFEKVGAAFKLAPKFLFLKKTIKDLISSMFGEVQYRINREKDKLAENA